MPQANTKTIQCPACSAPISYSGPSQKLECEYCGSSFSPEEIDKLLKGDDWKQTQADPLEDDGKDYETEQEPWEASDMSALICQSCGAELICDSSTAATSCPYCGNPSLIPGRFEGALKPDYVLPFKVDKEQAMVALKSYYRRRPLLPGSFSRENHLEKVQGVYVPFWLYDAVGEGDAVYHATRIFTRTSGDYRITTTDHFRLRRAGSVRFEKIPVDASSKMPDSHMDAIEPFDYSAFEPFSAAYLPGYMADRYDQDQHDCAARADERAKNTVLDVLGSTAVGYASCIPLEEQVRIRRGEAKYALLPVWLLSTRWHGKSYLFAMNGQTGKLIGDLPISPGRFAACFAGIALPLMGLLWLFLGGAL